MTVYDIDADRVTAVTAFLAQFSISNVGAIRFVSGSDTFHVAWLHRALQHKVWDFITSGDDDVQLSDPNPSTSQALGAIIALVDNTPQGFTVRYNIDETVATYLFGGSVSQQNAGGNEERWEAVSIQGPNGGSSQVQVVQNGVQLTSHWGTGKNQTASNVIARILVKTIDNGVAIDGRRITVKSHDFNNTFSNATLPLGLTESTAFANGDSDPFNPTSSVTVAAYGISKSEGYNLLNLDNAGNKPYLGAWSYSPQSGKQALYEYVKYLLSRTGGQTIYGVAATVWTGRVFEVDVASGAGTWVQNETLSWGSGATAGTGNLMGVDDTSGGSTTRLWLHLGTGVAPDNTTTITGNGGATGVVDTGGSTELASSPNLLGQFTGSWIGAFGIGFNAAQVTVTDSFTDLDGNTLSPPNFVSLNGVVECVNAADDPHVFLTLRSGSAPIYNQHTLNGAATSGAGSVTINGAIPSTTPLSGWIGLLASGGDNRVFYEYTSWSGSTFTLAGTLGESYANNDELMVAHFYESPVGGGTTKTLSNSLIYAGSPIDVIGWIRQGAEAAPDLTIPLSGQITAAGYSFNETLSREV